MSSRLPKHLAYPLESKHGFDGVDVTAGTYNFYFRPEDFDYHGLQYLLAGGAGTLKVYGTMNPDKNSTNIVWLDLMNGGDDAIFAVASLTDSGVLRDSSAKLTAYERIKVEIVAANDYQLGTIAAVAEGSVKEVTQIVAVADVSDSLDGTYFILQDDAGSVAFWIDTDDSGTTIPAGASAADRAVEITTINTNDSAATVGTAVYTAIVADSKFAAGADGGAGTFTVESSTYGVKGATDEGDSGFTITQDTAGVDSLLDGTSFILNDDVGSVGFWIDVDNSGTTVPAALVAATDRQVELITVTTGMTKAQVGTAVYTEIVADSKFQAGSDDLAGNLVIKASSKGDREAPEDVDSGFTIAESYSGLAAFKVLIKQV